MPANLTIARPYAKALFAIARSDKTISAWSDTLKLASQVIENPEVALLLQNPRVDKMQGYEWLKAICGKLVTPKVDNLFKLLAKRRRLLSLPEITILFEVYRAEQEKTIIARVTSAAVLTEPEQQRLQEVLKKRLQRDVSIEYALDSNLLAGFVVHADDLVIDGSVRGKLSRLNAELVN